MKRLSAVILVFAFFVSVNASVFALPAPVEKLKGGFMGVISSPLEIKDYTVSEFKGSHYNPFGLVGGFLKGTAYMIKKSVSGALDIATFPIK